MIGWCAWQLLGKAPQELQVKNPRAAATFNIGGPICASVCTVLAQTGGVMLQGGSGDGMSPPSASPARPFTILVVGSFLAVAPSVRCSLSF